VELATRLPARQSKRSTGSCQTLLVAPVRVGGWGAWLLVDFWVAPAGVQFVIDEIELAQGRQARSTLSYLHKLNTRTSAF
jgi:hypothetical protein